MVVQRGRLMKYSRLLFGPLTAAILSFAGGPAQAANLVTNGSFEDPAINTVDGSPTYDYTSSIANWTSGGHATVLFNAAYRPVSDALQAVQLEQPADALSQSFATVVSQAYQLTFDYSGYDAGPSSLYVSAGDNSGTYVATSSSYQTVTMNFNATSTSTTLLFRNDGIYAVSYPQIDNVSVTAVPEPETYAMLLAGLGALGFLARRRRD